MADRISRYRERLTPQETAIVESVTQHVMAAYGYEMAEWRLSPLMQDRRGSSAYGDGKVELFGTGDRRYAVRALTNDGRVGFAIVDGRAATPFEIQLRAATTVVLDVRGDDFAAYAVAVRNRSGDLLDVRRIEPRWRQQSMALPPDEYGLEIYDGTGRLVRRAPLVVGAQKQRLEVP